MKGLKDVMK